MKKRCRSCWTTILWNNLLKTLKIGLEDGTPVGVSYCHRDNAEGKEYNTC